MNKPKDDKTENTEKLTQLQTQLDECTNAWKRALADYQNLEKRVAEEKGDFVRFAAKNFIEKLLGIVDDLEKAQAHVKDEGLGLALKKLGDILKDEGVVKIETIGKDYDIETMEAISTTTGKEDNKVVEEFQAGYTMHGAVLRAAKVKVSKKK